MKKIKMAKRLTFIYFSIVATAIIVIHLSVFYSTFEAIEQSIAQKHFDQLKLEAQRLLKIEPSQQLQLSQYVYAYTDQTQIPGFVEIPKNIRPDTAYEVHPKGEQQAEYFIMKTYLEINSQPTLIWLVDFEDVYGVSRKELLWSQRVQIISSLLLLAISLLVVQRISGLLTTPLSQLSTELAQRSSDDLSVVILPKDSGIVTQELDMLVTSINQYQSKIKQLIERERAFNRYASHELRSPLMVIRGAASLLKESNEKSFVEKQRQRLIQASDEINEFISTLLTLTRDINDSEVGQYSVKRKDIEDTIGSYVHFISGKPVTCSVHIEEDTSVSIPLASFKIILGNLIKNAFIYTEQGQVDIHVSKNSLKVIDTGTGLNNDTAGGESHGLGLVIVGDICRKYGCRLTLESNTENGCIAEVSF